MGLIKGVGQALIDASTFDLVHNKILVNIDGPLAQVIPKTVVCLGSWWENTYASIIAAGEACEGACATALAAQAYVGMLSCFDALATSGSTTGGAGITTTSGATGAATTGGPAHELPNFGQFNREHLIEAMDLIKVVGQALIDASTYDVAHNKILVDIRGPLALAIPATVSCLGSWWENTYASVASGEACEGACATALAAQAYVGMLQCFDALAGATSGATTGGTATVGTTTGATTTGGAATAGAAIAGTSTGAATTGTETSTRTGTATTAARTTTAGVINTTTGPLVAGTPSLQAGYCLLCLVAVQLLWGICA